MIANKISKQVQEIPKSGIRDFFEIVQSMKDVISLGIGEPDFVTPWHIREAAIYSLEKGFTGYSSNLGHLKLRQIISKYLNRRYHLEYHPADEILVSVGVSEAIDIALRALLNPQDEVLYHEPCYVSYNPSIKLAGGVPVPIQTSSTQNFSLTAEQIANAITPKTKVLMLNFPTNPTGATISLPELEKIAQLCVEKDLVVLSDEIYGEIIYDHTTHHSIAALPGMKERTVYFNGVSKAYAMTGFRIGYACAPAVLVDAMMKIHQYAILCAPVTSQDAAIEALTSGAAEVERMRKEYELRRNFIVSSFNEMGLPCFKPAGSFYVFPNITPTGLSSRDFAIKLLETQQVAVVPGTAFGPGGEGFVRCSYATSLSQIKEAMQKIAKFLQAYP